MKYILLIILISLLGLPELVYSQSTSIISSISYQENKIVFNTNLGATLADANTNIYKYYINDSPPILIPTTCISNPNPSNPTFNPFPYTCSALAPVFKVGLNTIQVTQTTNVGGALESVKSSPLLVYFAINQITKESVIRCTPNTYTVVRVTDATKLASVLNAITNHVSSIVATSNAIYVFSCTISSN